jgi:ABC-type multidrug transport system fused ATPase/permease subunit
VVILDEPSSRLDPATERVGPPGPGRLPRGPDGHRRRPPLSTFALADDLLILDGGEVIEHGPRAVLAADPTSRYADMLRLAPRR